MAQQSSCAYDFFISRAGPDRDKARWIADRLERGGFRVLIQDWDFDIGGSFVTAMHTALQQCERTIALLSPAYLARPHCEIEWQAVLALDPNNLDGRLIPVRVEECAPGGLLAPLAYLDLVGATESEAEALISVAVDRKRPRTGGRWRKGDAEAFISNYTTFRTLAFTGRDDILQRLQRHFAEADMGASLPPVLVGMGGVGKSSIARELAERTRGELVGIWWIDARSLDSLRAGLAALARRLSPESAGEGNEEQLARLALQQLAVRRRKPWLLILDNVERPVFDVAGARVPLHAWLPPAEANVRVLLTSRYQAWTGYAKPFSVGPLGNSEAGHYLGAASGRAVDPVFGDIARALGELPLALAQCAGTLRENPQLPASQYFQEIESQLSQTPETTEYPASVFVTVDKAIEAIVQRQATVTAGGDVRAIMGLICFLDPAHIPLEVIEAMLPKGFEGIGARSIPGVIVANPQDTRRIISELVRFSIIEQVEGQEAISVHGVVQTIVRQRMAEHGRILVSLVLVVLSEKLPGVTVANARGFEWIFPHVLALFQHGTSMTTKMKKTLAGIAHWLSRMSYETGRYETAENFASQSKQQEFSSPHTTDAEKALRLLNHGESLRTAGKTEAAIKELAAALALFESDGGLENEAAAMCVHNLGLALRTGGYPAEAEELVVKALNIRKRVFGTTHFHYGQSLLALGGIRLEQDNTDEARKLSEEAVEIFSNSVGDSHMFSAMAHMNCGLIARTSGRYGEAAERIYHALSVFIGTVGPEHPEALNCLANFAETLLRGGEYEHAASMFAGLCTYRAKAFGAEHPSVLEAYSEHEQALKIAEFVKSGNIVVAGDFPAIRDRERMAAFMAQVTGGRSREANIQSVSLGPPPPVAANPRGSDESELPELGPQRRVWSKFKSLFKGS